MSELLALPPFAPRDDAALLREMNDLTRWHLDGCPEYRRVHRDFTRADALAALPFLHVGLFKRMLLKTAAPDTKHTRVLVSSSTTGAAPSRVALDERSSEVQARSSLAVLRAVVGGDLRPLLVLDSAASLRRRDVAARTAAALSLKPLSSEIHFLLADADDPGSVRWDAVAEVLSRHRRLLVYGFSSVLWQAWARADKPARVAAALAGATVHFAHSGGWKKLEHLRVSHEEFRARLLAGLAGDSDVVDFYGLVEQVGVVFPLCPAGSRHVPRWAAVLVRDPWSLAPLAAEPGLLQLMNPLPRGGPYHNVLTEDLGRLLPGECPCGRGGTRFELLGRVPRAEARGCANV